MKKAVLSGLFVVALAFAAFAQSSSKAAKGGGADQALKDLENRWVAALSKADTATLDSILADGYVETDEAGNVSDKQSSLAVLKSGDLKFNSVTVSDMQVHDYGNAAVVTGSGTEDGTYKGKALPSKIRFTDTFVKQGGKWKAVATHISAVGS